MDLNGIISESTIQMGALVLSILKILIGEIRSSSAATKKINAEYGCMIVYYIVRGVVLSSTKIKQLKFLLAKKHGIDPKRIDDIYTVLMNMYSTYMSSDVYTESQKECFEDNFKKYAKQYREPWQSNAVLLRTFLKDAGTVTVVMFTIVYTYIFFADLELTFHEEMMIAFALWSYSITINLLIQPMSYYFEKRRRVKKLRCARRFIKQLCREPRCVV